MEEPSDHHLLGQWLEARSQSAFEALVVRYGGMVHAVPMRAGDADAAEEVVQDTFITLARKAPLLRDRHSLAGWLHLTATHKTRDLLRKRRAETHKLRTFDEQMNPSPQSPSDPAWAALQPELDGALSRLGEQDRGMILLRFYRGLSLAEIVDTLEIGTKAAQKRLSRALERLRSDLRRRGCDPQAPLASTLAVGFARDASHLPVHLSRIVSLAVAPAAPLSPLLFIPVIMKSKSISIPVVALLILVAAGGLSLWPRGQTAEAASAPPVPPASGHSAGTPVPAAGSPAPRPKRPVVKPDDRYTALAANYGEAKVKAATKAAAATFAAMDAMQEFQLHVPALDRDSVPNRPPYKSCNLSPEQIDQVARIENDARQKAAALYAAKVAEIRDHSYELTGLILASDQCAGGTLSPPAYDQALAAAPGPVRASLSNIMRSPLLFAIDDELAALKKEALRGVLGPDQWTAYEREMTGPPEMSASVPPPPQKLEDRLREMEAMKTILEGEIKGAGGR
jgi:RNA polymerase sigma factor (sigma-70 family)